MMGTLQSELQKVTSVVNVPQTVAKPKKRAAGKGLYPKHVLLLVDAHGIDKAAEMLCMSRDGIRNITNTRTTSAQTERLAELLYNADDSTRVSRPRLLMCRVPVDKRDLVVAFLDALDVKHHDFAD